MLYESDPIIQRVKTALLPLEITDDADLVTREGQRAAAVLMLLVKRDGWHVIFTQRPEHMPRHGGEVSFPGGRIEPNEKALAAALRETHEEIGVDASQITPLGRLPSFDAISNFRVTPFAGIVNAQTVFTPDPGEVEDIFEVPFSFLMDHDNHVPRPVQWKDSKFTIYDMPYLGTDGIHRHIWGMTAMMMYRLWQRGFAP